MPPSASARSLRRQRAVIVGVAVVLAGAGIGVPLAQHLTRPRLVAPDRVAAYQVTYQVSASAAAGAGSTYWELLTVQRPFASTDLVYRDRPDPPGIGVAVSGSLFTKDALYSVQVGVAHEVSGRQPGPGGDDPDLSTQLPELVERGLARDLGQSRTLAGRACEVYRFSGPPSGAVTPLGGSDHDDLCLDPQGLELGERWTYHGRVVQDRRAVQVRMGRVSQPISASGPPRSGSGVPSAVPDTAATAFVPTPPLPDGFSRAGTFRFSEPDPRNGGALLAASVVWAFVDGGDVITVEAGQGPPGELPWGGQPTRTAEVRLSGLGSAETAIRSDGAEVRVDLGNGRWLRVRGTVPVDGLVAYADTLPPRG